MSGRTLLVVGGALRSGAETEAPRRDYEVLAARLGADVLRSAAPAREARARSGFALARAAAARAAAYDTIYCDSEHTGLPLAALLRAQRGPRLIVLAHYLTPLKKQLLVRSLALAGRIDRLIVHSEAQADRARRIGFTPRRVTIVPYQVDPNFWRPRDEATHCIASAGQEFRDYLTLMRAVRDLPLPVRIAAGSHWSNRDETFSERDVPANVSVRTYSYAELRDLYAGARFVVVPLLDVDFQAGIITILEAMSMGKAVIVSRTRGQHGVINGPLMRNGELVEIGERTWHEPTGIYVAPRDSRALRAAITYLLDHPDRAAAMGAAGRRHVEASYSVDEFAARLAAIIEPAVSAPAAALLAS